MAAIYQHTNVNSPDWEKLATFYEEVFGCVRIDPMLEFQGAFIDRAVGSKGVHLKGILLALPGYGAAGGPALEIYTQEDPDEGGPAPYRRNGFAHLGFIVDDIVKTLDSLVEHGGSKMGEISGHCEGDPEGLPLFVYAKDPDGNILELMQLN